MPRFAPTRTTWNILDRALRLQLARPHAETACLIRESVKDEQLREIGLSRIMFMERSFSGLDHHNSRFLSIDRSCEGRYLRCWNDEQPLRTWHLHDGFAFVRPQVSLQD